jgi:hypothetical protein
VRAAPGRDHQGIEDREQPDGGEETGQPEWIGPDQIEVADVTRRRGHCTDQVVFLQLGKSPSPVHTGLQPADGIEMRLLVEGVPQLRVVARDGLEPGTGHGPAFRQLIALDRWEQSDTDHVKGRRRDPRAEHDLDRRPHALVDAPSRFGRQEDLVLPYRLPTAEDSGTHATAHGLEAVEVGGSRVDLGRP